jgi:hypothetical protein
MLHSAHAGSAAQQWSSRPLPHASTDPAGLDARSHPQLAVAGHDVRNAGQGGRLPEAEFIGEEQVAAVGVLTLSDIRTSSDQVGSRG